MNTSPTGISQVNVSSKKIGIDRQDQVNKAVINKLIRSKTEPANYQPGSVGSLPNHHDLLSYSKEGIRKSNDTEVVFETLPDLRLAADLSISSILATKDLVTSDLLFSCDNKDIPMNLKSELLSLIKEHFDSVYPIRDYLRDILMDTLYMTGSYGVAVIPESSVDRIINSGAKVALEAFDRTTNGTGKLPLKGILGKIEEPKDTSRLVGLEAILNAHKSVPTHTDMVIRFDDIALESNTPDGIKPFTMGEIYVTDNVDSVKMGKIKRRLASSTVKTTYNVGLEHIWAGPEDQDKTLHKAPNSGTKTIEAIDVASDSHRDSVGHPLIEHYPSESIIPVHVPGNFKELVGVLVVLDELGHGISKNGLIGQHSAHTWVLGDATTETIQRAAASMGHGETSGAPQTVQQLTQAYSEIVEGKLVASIRNGVYGSSATVARPESVYRIMMARSLANMSTQILFIPSEQFTYFAVDYNKYGIGKSLMEQNSILSGIRTALALSTVMSTIKNATPSMQYTIELDPDDREGKKTIVEAQGLIMESFNRRFPMNGTPDDMANYIGNANIHFNVIGNQYMASTKISVEDNSPDYKVPDTELDEGFAKKQYRSMNCDPDLVMNPESIEFAAQVTSKSLLTTSRSILYQNQFNPLFTHLCKTIILSDGFLLADLCEAIRRELGPDEAKRTGVVKYHLDQFMSGLVGVLPPPDNTSIMTNQKNQFDEYTAAMEAFIAPFVEDTIFEGSSVSEATGRVSAVILAYLQRKWIRERNVEPDIIQFFDSGDDKESLNDSVSNVVEDLCRLGIVNGLTAKRAIARLAKLDAVLELDDALADTGVDTPEPEADNDTATEDDEFSFDNDTPEDEADTEDDNDDNDLEDSFTN